MKKLDRLTEPQELRAFEIFDHVPPNCALCVMHDGSHDPHLRAGEFAIADLSDTAFVSGELYLCNWGTARYGVRLRRVWQLNLRAYNFYPDGHADMGIYFSPLNRMKFLADGQIDQAGPLYLGDGPLKPEALHKYCLGRIIGIFQAPHCDLWDRPAPSRTIGNGGAS